MPTPEQRDQRSRSQVNEAEPASGDPAILEASRRAAELDAVLASAPDGLMIFSPAGEIVRMNRAAERLLGYGEAERQLAPAERMAWLQAETTDGRKLSVEELPHVRALQGETVEGYVMVVQPPPVGRRMWLSAGAAPLSLADGTLLGAVESLTDVSRAYELHEQREEILRMVSHDLRTPLTIIQLQGQLLQRMFAELDPQTRERRAAQIIVSAAERMEAMIRDVVDSARLAAGTVRPEKQTVDLYSFVADLIVRAAGALDVQRIEIGIPEDLPPAAADPASLERVFMNLITNGLNYSHVEKVEIGARKSGAEVIVSVADRGYGIDPEDLPRIFERHCRPKSSLRRAKGLGLSLYIARMLVETEGGRIWAESRIGEGSTFFFSLPIAEG